MTGMYAWDVVPAGRSDGWPSGVTDTQSRAARHVIEALKDCPVGSRAQVRKVALSPTGALHYVDLYVFATAYRSKDGVRWTDADC